MRLLKIIIIIIFLFFSKLYSQNIGFKDSVFIMELVKKSKDLAEEKTDSAIYFSQKAITISQKLNFSFGQIHGYNALASAYKNNSEYEKSILNYNYALDLAKQTNSEVELGIILYNISGTYEYMGLYDKSFESITKSLEVRRKLKDSVGIARCYRQIAQCMCDKGDNKLAISYFEKAILMQEKLSNKRDLAASYVNMSVIYIDEKKYSEALKFLNKSLLLYEANKLKTSLVAVYLNLGYCYHCINNYDSTVYYYNKAIIASEIVNDKRNEIIALNNIGEFYLETNNLILAEKYLKKCQLVATEYNDYITLIDVYSNLSKLYVKYGDYKNALYCKDKFFNISDSLSNIDRIKAIEEISVKFQTKEIETQNKNLQNEISLQKIKAEKKNYLIYGSILLLILFLVIFLLYVRQNKFKTQKESLDIEQKLLQIQMNPHFIFNSLQAIQSFILTNKPEQSSSYLTSFSRLMRLILENSKQEFITLDKEITTLTYYLELQKLRFKNVFDFKIEVNESIDKEFLLVPPMILQPFIENAIEHGFKNIDYKGVLQFIISTDSDNLILQVIDNGLGIEKSAKDKTNKNHHSYALEIISKRIELLNLKLKNKVKLSIEDLSKTNNSIQGTKITLKIPYIHSK